MSPRPENITATDYITLMELAKASLAGKEAKRTKNLEEMAGLLHPTLTEISKQLSSPGTINVWLVGFVYGSSDLDGGCYVHPVLHERVSGDQEDRVMFVAGQDFSRAYLGSESDNGFNYLVNWGKGEVKYFIFSDAKGASEALQSEKNKIALRVSGEGLSFLREDGSVCDDQEGLVAFLSQIFKNEYDLVDLSLVGLKNAGNFQQDQASHISGS